MESIFAAKPIGGGRFSTLHPLGPSKGGASWGWPESQKSKGNVSKTSKEILAQDLGLDLVLDRLRFLEEKQGVRKEKLGFP